MIDRQFILAGNSTFTVSNDREERYTYRIRMNTDPQWGTKWFAKVLTGQDNSNDYTYVGIVETKTGNVRLTKKSRFAHNSKPYKVLRWALAVMWKQSWDKLPDGYRIQHAGRCGRCGRKLTEPRSLRTGIGPECRRQMGNKDFKL